MNRVVARRVPTTAVDVSSDPDLVARYLEDAAHFPGGHAPAVARPRDVAEIASLLRSVPRILPVGAQSSLTGGATPFGDIVLSTERLTAIDCHDDTVEAGAGVTLQSLQQALAQRGRWFPPVPTYLGATVGGAVSTCAAGAATFKYGSVRPWVDALTVVLPGGDVLDLARGEAQARDGTFVIVTSGAERTIELPPLRMPSVPKHSAGYYSAPDMDLVDLFIGAEGTLGVVVTARLRVTPRPAGSCWVLIQVPDEPRALALTSALRAESRRTWTTRDERGVDVAAIEHLDHRSIEIVREDGVDRRLQVAIDADTRVVLLAQVELPAAQPDAAWWQQIADALDPQAPDTPLTRLCRLLDRYGALARTEIALPSDARRAASFVELREAVPSGVNRRVGLAHAADPRIHKTAADIIVPDAQFAAMMHDCRELCAAASLDLAVWGHISDGNVHPNVIPRSFADVERGAAVFVELARRVVTMGGCPLAEHGVGRSRVKQQLLQMLYGREGVAAMRRVKLSLDPDRQLAPGVLFEEA